jgi:hypothetical protein
MLILLSACMCVCMYQYYNPADFLLEIVSDLTNENIEAAERAEKVSPNGNASANGSAVKAFRQMNGSSHSANEHGKPDSTSTKDGIDLEKGVAKDLLQDTLPDKTFDVQQDSSESKVVRRLPLLWSKHSTEVFELEKRARDKQQQQLDSAQQEVMTHVGVKGNGDQHISSPNNQVITSPDGMHMLTLSAVEKRLADESLDEDNTHSSQSRWPLTWWEQMVLLLSRAFVQHKGERVTSVPFTISEVSESKGIAIPAQLHRSIYFCIFVFFE